MKAKDFKANIFTLFDQDWALVTSGSLTSHNSMTISWGEMGTIWHKDVITIYVKPVRYTHNFIEKNEYFVVSFFDKNYRNSLTKMGSVSGRIRNKDEYASLTPYEYKDHTLYKEAKISFICKKIYQNELDIKNIPSKEIDTYYKEEAPHTMYIGEIVEVIS